MEKAPGACVGMETKESFQEGIISRQKSQLDKTESPLNRANRGLPRSLQEQFPVRDGGEAPTKWAEENKRRSKNRQVAF